VVTYLTCLQLQLSSLLCTIDNICQQCFRYKTLLTSEIVPSSLFRHPTMVLRYPDEFLPESQLSLEEFSYRAMDLLRNAETIPNFVRMVLAGRDTDHNDVVHRLFLNARQGLEDIDPGAYIQSRDYDSAHGITRDLPFTEPLSIFPVASFRDTLTKDIHILGKAYDNTVSCDKQIVFYMTLMTSKGTEMRVSLHKIPNVAFGKVLQRHITRIVFPRLYRANEAPQIPQDLLETLYDTAIRPAVRTAVPERLSHWPPTYRAAMANARDIRGQLHFGSVDLPAFALGDFRDALLHILDQHDTLKDAYFLHEVRGYKGATVHNPEVEAECWDVLHEKLNFLDFRLINHDQWYIDVGLEVHLRDHVLQWLEDGHLRLLRNALPRQNQSNPNSLATLADDANNFKTDRVAQLNEFAGFRCTPRSKGLADQVTYINVYTTDKEPLYQLHTGSFRRHHASELMPGERNIQTLMKDVAEISGVFGQCVGTVTRAASEGCARFEVRVKLRQSPTVLRGLPQELISNSLVAIRAPTWWLVPTIISFHPLSFSFTGNSNSYDCQHSTTFFKISAGLQLRHVHYAQLSSSVQSASGH
jgi:hypothetical protein